MAMSKIKREDSTLKIYEDKPRYISYEKLLRILSFRWVEQFRFDDRKIFAYTNNYFTFATIEEKKIKSGCPIHVYDIQGNYIIDAEDYYDLDGAKEFVVKKYDKMLESIMGEEMKSNPPLN